MSVNLTSLKKITSIVLCKINKVPIGEILVDLINSEKRNLNDIHEIQLTIPRYVIDETTKEKKEYILYKEFKNKRYLYVNDSEYFVIENIKENKRKTEKNITAYKGEYALSKKSIIIEDAYMQLMNEDFSDENYPIYSINNELKKATGWTFGSIDNDVLYSDTENKVEVLRRIESIDGDWYSFITGNLSNLFNCIPFFDTVNRKVDLVRLENFGEDIQLCLSYDNYMNDLTMEFESKDLITRLTLVNDNLDIAGSTVTGYNHINDFSYFIEIEEMSNELILALEKYEEMITERNKQWKILREKKVQKMSEMSIKKNQWFITNSQMNVLLNQTNVFRAENDVVNTALKQIEYAEKMDEELLLRKEIQSLEEEVALLDESIRNINELCRYETCTNEKGQLVFTEDLLIELKEFIFEDSFKEEAYLNEEDMINAGKRQLELSCKPTVTYSIDVVNFISRIIDNNFRQHWNGVLSFGDIIILLDNEGKEDFVYFTGYDYDYKNDTLSLTLSNKKIYGDSIHTIRDSLRTTTKLNKLLNQNNYLFNDTKNLRLNMKDREIQ